MKKRNTVILIYLIVLFTYVATYLLNNSLENANERISFSFAVFYLLLSMFITILVIDKNIYSFPLGISGVFFSILFVIISIVFNFLSLAIDENGERILSVQKLKTIELIGLAIYAVALIVMASVGKHTIGVNERTSIEVNKQKMIISRIEKLKNKLLQINADKRIVDSFDKILENIQFSNFSINVDNTSIDDEIDKLLNRLEGDVSDILNADSVDYETIINTLSLIDSKIKDRDENIKINNFQI